MGNGKKMSPLSLAIKEYYERGWSQNDILREVNRRGFDTCMSVVRGRLSALRMREKQLAQRAVLDEKIRALGPGFTPSQTG